MSETVTVESVRGARRVALAVDFVAVAASTAANIADALLGDSLGDEGAVVDVDSSGVGAVAVAVIAPFGLCLAIMLWHRSQVILSGWLRPVFNTGLAGVATGAAVVSFGHLRSVAIHFGQTETDATIIALVVDGAAVLAALVIVAAGQKLAEISAAAERTQLVEREANRAAERERREQLAAEREADRAAEAKREEDRAAERERREQLAAEREAGRVAVAEREVEEREAKRVAVANVEPKPKAGSGGSEVAADDAIRAYLVEHPDGKQAEVAKHAGVSARTVSRSVAWKDHRAALKSTTQKPKAGKGGDGQAAVDRSSVAA